MSAADSMDRALTGAAAVRVIGRHALSCLSSVVVAGQRHTLGEVRSFRSDAELAAFLPLVAPLSLSWVRLASGEALDTHTHETKSMIVIAEGCGTVIGDIDQGSQGIRAGDIVAVPPGARHGFIGGSPDGFWALSIQFEESALYDDAARPQVEFAQPDNKLQAFEALAQEHMERFANNPLFDLVDGTAHVNAEVRARMLDFLQPWSDAFQRIACARVYAESDPRACTVAQRHLAEEIGHNAELARTRGDTAKRRWDPIIDAVSSWFVDRMVASTSAARTVLMHFVLESSSLVFHSRAKALFPDSKYFAVHAAFDEHHLQMGRELLAQDRSVDLAQLTNELEMGWQMIEMLCSRIAVLASSGEEHT
ncbi:hypothetical protein LJR230_001232 [Trinickia sp. LjRoot230]|uniref:cupin domain-containing protein n=1 Tax=Trinickia sp. LjRoot230 TaxID=3342288 RepID=UPI003ECF743D